MIPKNIGFFSNAKLWNLSIFLLNIVFVLVLANVVISYRAWSKRIFFNVHRYKFPFLFFVTICLTLLLFILFFYLHSLFNVNFSRCCISFFSSSSYYSLQPIVKDCTGIVDKKVGKALKGRYSFIFYQSLR